MNQDIYNINKDRPKITKEEIEGYKNFDALMNAYQAAPKPMIPKQYYWMGSGLIAACTVVAILYFTGVFKGSHKDMAFINPPIPSLAIRYKEFEMDADSGGTINYPSGTKIIVPAGALTDQNGNLVHGKVNLKYREFRDMTECLLSGIPMNYDSAGIKSNFQTAGMFDIGAMQGANKLSIAQGKEVKVQLASLEKGQNFNFYKLDTVNKKWSYLRKDTSKLLAEINGQPNLGNSEIIYADNDSKDLVNRKPKHAIRKLSKDTFIINQNSMIGQPVNPFIPPKIVEQNTKFIKKPIPPREATKTRQTATIDFDPKDFPELNIYKGVKFEIGDENKNFDKNSFNTVWESATLTRGPKEGSYNLLLTKGDRKYNVLVYPVLEGKDFKDAQKVYEAKYKAYENTVKKQQEMAARRKAEAQAREKRLMEQNAKEWQRQKAENEKRWKRDSVLMNQVTEYNIMRTMSVSSFGIYNIDCPQIFNNPRIINGKLIDKNGNAITVNELYLIDKSRSFFYRTEGQWARTGHIQFDPVDDNLFFGILSDNKIAYFRKKPMQPFYDDRNQNVTIQMDVSDKPIASADKLKEFIMAE